MVRIYLIGIVLILLASSCDDNSLKDVTSYDLVGTWDAKTKVERYIDGEYDESYFSPEGETELLLRQDGTGMMTTEQYTDLELIWAYVPTRQKVYLNVTIDSVYSSPITKEIIEVKNNSQLWQSELEIGNNTTYLTTWDLKLK